MSEKELEKYEIISDLINDKINGTDASKMLNLSTRQVRRLKRLVIKHGVEGLAHKNRGKVSNRRIDNKTIDIVKDRLKEKYYDFGPTFATEKLEEDEKIKISKETIRNIMVNIGLWKIKSRKKSKKWHVWRARKDNYGEMEQFDGSYHDWFEGRCTDKGLEEEQCLLLSVDDASGKITYAKFGKNESTLAVFDFFKEYFLKNGLPLSIYLDKFSTFKINHKNAVDNKDMLTQFQRAMNQLGVKPITAHSPEAKGRVEKMFKTLQDRLVKEMRLANITTIKEANHFLKYYIDKFNAKFAVVTNRKKDLHRNLNKQTENSLDQILSIQNTRVINNDYTIRFNSNYYQLTRQQTTTVYKRDKVVVEERLNGEIKFRLRNTYLNYFSLPGRPKKEIDIKLPALTRQIQGSYVPPASHPWRKMYIYKKV